MQKINSQDVMYKSTKNDESYTPQYGVEPIKKYVRLKASKLKDRHLVVWAPFDKKESFFVETLSSVKNVTVVHSHIDEGKDFFDYEPEEWDVIVSNPPFTNKRAYFERAISFNKPFALIMSNTWLNDSAPKHLFKDIDLQLLMFSNRMLFIQDGEINTKITFSVSYYCYDFLPKQIIMCDIKSPGQFKKDWDNKKQSK